MASSTGRGSDEIGAGGASGGAFAVGVLLALATGHGVDLRNASHLVGTSAGSVLAGLIALGLGSEDLAAMVARTPHRLSPKVVGRASSIFAANRLSSELRRNKSDGGVLVIEPAGALGGLVIDDALDGTATSQILAFAFLAASRAPVTHRRISPR
ncbi:MAG: patatin-like phospholipase family protein [Ilumatobacteraceae bacterium]